MRAAVTGCAGFIGSTLAEALLARGDHVVGLDSLSSYYSRAAKSANMQGLVGPRFEYLNLDLTTDDLVDVLSGVEVVFHQAGQPGVRLSWADGFSEYVSANVIGTQRLLEAMRLAEVPRLVFASSSSIYGQAPSYPTCESELPAPHSPYGVTKLAAEHLCSLYASNWGMHTVSLRYFTVYGPRQRPDMAIHRMFEAGLDGSPFPLYGDGSARRDFTYVGDVVRANLAAGSADVAPGTYINVAGGGDISMLDLLRLVGETLGAPIAIDQKPGQAGDVIRTGGAIEQAERLLGWSPLVAIREGLVSQAAWHRGRRGEGILP